MSVAPSGAGTRPESTTTGPAAAPAGRLAGRAVLVLNAHPDDESIFTAVAVRRLADQGARVVLVTATCGELGERFTPLDPGESLRARRLAELTHAADVLGARKVVTLGRRDSGMTGWPAGRHPLAFARARADRMARLVADIARDEGAEAILFDDARGIYGHPDHVAVHRVGALAARLAGIVPYQTTVDRQAVAGAPATHFLHSASRGTDDVGQWRPGAGVRLTATARELEAKRAALLAHPSQIHREQVLRPGFAETYRTEWFLTAPGRRGVLDEIAG